MWADFPKFKHRKQAIYRGPGGAGDATVDATNAAALVAIRTQEATDAATAAAASAAEAAASAVIASTGLSGIAAYAAAAAGSAADASDSADAAAISESNANEDAGTASTKANEASASAAAAAASASSASSSASSASTSASNASTSASNASSSASSASSSAASAANSASDAAVSASLANGYLPSFTGNNGKYLKTNGTNALWATVDALPTQTGNSGKYLTTNGTAASWVDLSVAPATPTITGTVFGRTDSGVYAPPTALTNGTNGYWFGNPDAYSIYSNLTGDYNGPGAPGDINTAVGNGTIQVGMSLVLVCTRISTGLQEAVNMGVITSIVTGGGGAVTITGTNAINWSLYADSGVWFGYKRIVHQLTIGGLVAENVTLGNNAGTGITTGGENVLLGDSAGNNVGSGRNNVVIGNAATASAQNVSNEVTLGNSSHTKTRLFGALAVGGSSTGTSGQVLTSAGSGSAPTWTNAAGVSSVAMSVPTGLSVSGSPITSSGTLAVTYSSGYSIPLDSKQTNWDTAYGWGNHASAGYLTSATAASTYAPLTGTGTSGTWGISITGNAATVTNGLYSTGSYSNPTWLTSISGSIVSGNISGNAANVTGTVAIANGGTGQTTQQAAINALTGTQSSGKYLRSDGTDASLSTIQAADVPTLNQNTTGTAANITATSNSTLTTLSALSLPGSQVSGNISGNAANVTGTVAIASGGSGQTTAQAAMNAFAGAVTSGSYLRGNGTNVVMSTIQAADVPTLNQNTTGTAANVTGTVAVANGGTGSTTLTANNVLLGNGTSALQVVAPGTSGNVLTSNGTTWVSSAPSGGGGSAATPTALGTVYGSMTTSGASPYLTALGYNAGLNNTGANNTAVGTSALQTNTSGTLNTAVGYEALLSNTTAGWNTAVGNGALRTNSTGAKNTAVGRRALYSNTTGTDNAAFGTEDSGGGYGPLWSNTTGNYNTALGNGALGKNTTASNNTAVGYQAGYTNSTGLALTAIGFQAGYSTNANSNTAIGYRVMRSNSSGTQNVAVGCNASSDGTATLEANTTGAYNTAIGAGALLANTTASQNTAVGYSTLAANTTGYDNTAVGNSAGYSLTTGYRNTFIGANAGQGGFGAGAFTTGFYNISIGFAAGASATNRNNSIVIGTPYAVVDKGENTGFIQPNGGGVYQGNNSSSWSTTSDRRLKKNIVDNNVGLEKLMQVQVRNFEYRLPSEVEELEAHCAIKKEGVQLGVIAQELQQVFPDCVKEESTGVLSVDPDNLTWYTINAIKQLKAELDAAKAEIAALKGQA